MLAPRSYGPIKQLVSEQGSGATHCGYAAPKPTTPKPNAARMINFVMGNLLFVFRPTNHKRPRCKCSDQRHKTFDLFGR
jgi:hypothetical protein